MSNSKSPQYREYPGGEFRSPYFQQQNNSNVFQYQNLPLQQQPQRTVLESLDNNQSMSTARRQQAMSLRPERDLCREHPEEEVNYFCFDCQSCPPICSECVIHGSHKGHNVATVKKAYPQILAKIEELQLAIGSKVDELQLQNQRLESRKREVADQTQAIKQQMANAFEELRQRLDKKEREMMSNADGFLEKNIIEIDSYVRLVQGRCLNLNQTSEHITQTAKISDEIQLLSFYAGNFSKIQHSTLESDIPQLNELPKQVSFKCEVDMNSLNKFVEELQGLHLNISALEGEIVSSNQKEGPGNNLAGLAYQKQNLNHSRHNKLQPYFHQQQQEKLAGGMSSNQFSSWNSSGNQERPQAFSRPPYPAPQHPGSLGASYEGLPYSYSKGNLVQGGRMSLNSQVAQTLNKLNEQKYGLGGGFGQGLMMSNGGNQNRHHGLIQQTPPQHDSFF